MHPPIETHRAAKHGVTDVRVFGSMARGARPAGVGYGIDCLESDDPDAAWRVEGFNLAWLGAWR